VEDNSNEEGWTPLTLSAHVQNFEIAKFLLESGANPVKSKNNGMNLFHLAAANNDVRLLELALNQERHYTVDMLTEDGWTPAHNAAFMNNFDSLNLMMENGADLSLQNKSDMNAFECLIRNDHHELLEVLLPQALKYH